MLQWVKNLTTLALGCCGGMGSIPGWCSGLKDLALPQLRYRSQLWLGFNPWPRNFHMLGSTAIKKKKKE